MKHCKNCDNLLDAMGEKPDNHISKKALEYRMAAVKTLKWLGWSSPAESMELRQVLASKLISNRSRNLRTNQRRAC